MIDFIPISCKIHVSSFYNLVLGFRDIKQVENIHTLICTFTLSNVYQLNGKLNTKFEQHKMLNNLNNLTLFIYIRNNNAQIFLKALKSFDINPISHRIFKCQLPIFFILWVPKSSQYISRKSHQLSGYTY